MKAVKIVLNGNIEIDGEWTSCEVAVSECGRCFAFGAAPLPHHEIPMDEAIEVRKVEGRAPGALRWERV